MTILDPTDLTVSQGLFRAFAMTITVSGILFLVCVAAWFARLKSQPERLQDLLSNPPGMSPRTKANMFIAVASAGILLSLVAVSGF